jgi:rhodanese-related sulfurtransferase
MKASQALVFYAIFITVVLVVTAGFVFKRTTPDESPFWLTPQQAKNLIDSTSDVVVINVSRHFNGNGQLPGAVNYPKCSLPGAVSDLDRNSNLLVYCRGTGAPLVSASRLKEAGFNNVYALKGNYSAWVKAGYPVEN